jgi:two-component system sensor histidine kinase/response regulator
MNAFKRSSGNEPVANTKLVLLAEDHPLNQKVAMLLLERMGFDVHLVVNGVQAVEAAARTDYDAILMDCHMPEMDGFDATRAIRLNEEKTGKHVPIIAVTALAMAGDRERCLSAGMDDYVTKPIDRDLLREKLIYWMNPGTLNALNNTSKVIQIFETAFSSEHREEPLKFEQFMDAYGDEAPDLLMLFIHSSEKSVNEMKQALEERNCTKMASLAHELKGASWAVGADEIARLSVFIEQAAAQANWRLIHRTFVRLTHHFDELKHFVEARLLPESSSVQR